ncbi:alpha-L-arabinofuranosidase C-terminal domain-containing protein [Bacteroides stercorirosoris]|jgi:alpha-N-arabinofuranosidase|uniref:non-reducing end alpha-L-arabinofuranosidase n=1 Tax=Bacteroides stercorirosoris TaxID=871324 RepID=A0A413H1R2_9BACE|nr:alpha-L-arabinofuranosidase C-terminal domain-containing protein [Bacteroides stercorirosoris]RGX77379.1 alpha-L-arabinofuranosidase [Bacteroides stercorirosoris]
MKQNLLCFAAAALLMSSCGGIVPEEELVINLQEKGAEVAPSMYGIFFEEINHAGDGGLYAELVKNRSFEELEMPEGYYAEGDILHPKEVCNHLTGEVRHGSFRWTTEPVPGWILQTGENSSAEMKLTKENPKFQSASNNLKVTIKDASAPVRLVNGGYWGMNLVKDDSYLLRAILRTSADYKGKITALLLSDTDEVLALAPVEVDGSGSWNDVHQTLRPSATAAKGKLALEFDGTGTVSLDYVSLFPEKTFRDRPNGLRNDVAEMLNGLHPAFVRWPGGCVVEGISLENRFEWKKTLGDPASRSGEYSTWGYRCSYGFGYHEMLQFCEDINADAMFVCNVGLGCQYRMGDASPESKIAYYLDDCMDAIEYALGDVTTEWGAKRAAQGHPQAFPLKYVEIGNENWGDEYDKRFDIFYKAIKAKYPELILISNHGLGGTGKIAKTDMIDPHWYVNPEFFFQNTTIFDSHPRGKYDAYVGEYACNANVGGGNMRAALSEAAFISGMERNGDLVKMASYAPLLENRNDRSWAVNLIWLDTDQVLGRSSYYVQQMAAENRPTYNVKSNLTMGTPQPLEYEAGRFGFGSWNTQVEFKDVKVTEEDGTAVNLDLNSVADKKGAWMLENGVLSQTSLETPTRYIVDGFSGNRFTLECQVRKVGGHEGFFLYFGLSQDDKKGFVYNVAGWNNQSTAVEGVSDGQTTGVVGDRVSQSLENNKWYDVKLVVTPQKSELYMDGKLIMAYAPETTPLQFFSSGYDEATGELIVKVVNAEAEAYPLRVKLDGVSQVEKTGKVISLSAASDMDENSFEEPKKIYPQESEFKGFGKSFSYTFPPFSYTILRVKAN